MDEYVRNQLDRRSRVLGIRVRNEQELRQSFTRVEDARSRSPQRRYWNYQKKYDFGFCQ